MDGVTNSGLLLLLSDDDAFFLITTKNSILPCVALIHILVKESHQKLESKIHKKLIERGKSKQPWGRAVVRHQRKAVETPMVV
jgi:hypothetical protein